MRKICCEMRDTEHAAGCDRGDFIDETTFLPIARGRAAAARRAAGNAAREATDTVRSAEVTQKLRRPTLVF
jgi:hypothetical protein